jgi:hypothetical protein
VIEQVAGVGEEDWQEVEQGQHQDKVGAGGRAVGWGGVGEEDGRRWSRVSTRTRLQLVVEQLAGVWEEDGSRWSRLS